MVNNNIILLGMPGSGKSSIGWALSKLMGYGYIDLDRWIEQTEKESIANLINRNGEDNFRQLETRTLHSLSTIHSHVLAVGGGCAQRSENWDFFEKMGLTVWLNPPVSELVRRLLRNPDQIKARPFLAHCLSESHPTAIKNKLTEKLNELLELRKPRYQSAQIIFSDAYSSVDFAAIRLKQIANELFDKNQKVASQQVANLNLEETPGKTTKIENRNTSEDSSETQGEQHQDKDHD